MEEEVPIQFFQSVIAIQLAVTGALLFQVRFVSPREKTRREDERLPSATLRLAVAVSILPILLRVLPPLRRDLQTGERPRYVVVTVVGVVVYVVLVAAAVTLVEL